MFEKSFIDLELEKRIALSKQEIEKRYQHSFDKLDLALTQISEGVLFSHLTEWKKVEEVWNVAGFVTMTYYDLKIVLMELSFSTNEWRKRYFARQACLLVYEACKDIPPIIGKKFIQQTVILLSESEVHTEQLRGIKQAISEYNRKYEELLSQVRNACIAHREHQVLKQIKLIDQLSWSKVLPVISEFDAILYKLFEYVQHLMNKSQREFQLII